VDKNISNRDINNLLRWVRQDISCHNRHVEKKGDRFNIFSVLSMGRREVGTHSRFIYELLNPGGTHGQGDTFLKIFIKTVLEIDSDTQFVVHREYCFTENRRRIDFLIESSDYTIGIEMKIDAGDQSGQMNDYRHSLKRRSNQKKVKLYYLSLDGKPASSRSIKGLSDTDYQRISFQSHIIEWINLCIKESALKPILREALLQYKSLLESLTGENEEMNKEIAEKLASSRSDLQAAIAVESSLVEAKIILQERFWTLLMKKLKSEDKNVTVYRGGKTYSDKHISKLVRNYYTRTRNIRDFGVKFHVMQCSGYSLWMYVNLFQAIHYGLRLEDDKGAIKKQPSLRTDLRKSLGNGNAVSDKNTDWVICFYFDPDADQNEEHGVIELEEFNESTFGLADDKKMKETVNSIVKHMKRLVSTVKGSCQPGLKHDE